MAAMLSREKEAQPYPVLNERGNAGAKGRLIDALMVGSGVRRLAQGRSYFPISLDSVMVETLKLSTLRVFW